MAKRLKQAWKRDQLGLFGIGSAVVAFVVWAWPEFLRCEGWDLSTYLETRLYEIEYYQSLGCSYRYGVSLDETGWFIGPEYFATDRLPAAAAFLALAFILLILRRR